MNRVYMHMLTSVSHSRFQPLSANQMYQCCNSSLLLLFAKCSWLFSIISLRLVNQPSHVFFFVYCLPAALQALRLISLLPVLLLNIFCYSVTLSLLSQTADYLACAQAPCPSRSSTQASSGISKDGAALLFGWGLNEIWRSMKQQCWCM